MTFRFETKCLREPGERRQTHEQDWRAAIFAGDNSVFSERVVYGESEACVTRQAELYIKYRCAGCSALLAKEKTKSELAREVDRIHHKAMKWRDVPLDRRCSEANRTVRRTVFVRMDLLQRVQAACAQASSASTVVNAALEHYFSDDGPRVAPRSGT